MLQQEPLAATMANINTITIASTCSSANWPPLHLESLVLSLSSSMYEFLPEHTSLTSQLPTSPHDGPPKIGDSMPIVPILLPLDLKDTNVAED
jgi:hypothetical protein